MAEGPTLESEFRRAERHLQRAVAAETRLAEVEASIEEIDRNARAYGWEIGRGHPLHSTIKVNSPDNPFLDSDWRSKILAKFDA